jgi:Subtilase family
MSSLQPDRPSGGGARRPLPENVAEAPGGEFFYRPGRVVVTTSDAERARTLEDFIREWNGDYPTEPTEPIQGVRVFPVRGNVLALLAEARRRFGGGGIEPDYVFLGAQTIKGGPWDEVEPAAPPIPPWLDSKYVGDGFTVGILDTGIAFDPVHPWLDGRFTADRTVDVDTPNLGNQNFLATEGGHGTFIAGVVSRLAPAAHLAIVKVLDADGIGSVTELLLGIRRVVQVAQSRQYGRLDVLNLSLGGYTQQDQPPEALRLGLQPLIASGTVVVAAAGNFGSPQPFWPAAFDEVIGVGAVDGWGPAPFTNYGPWVDACAPGVKVLSTFFDESAQPLAGVDLPPATGAAGDPPVEVTFPGYARWSGTSFAAPKVAGAIVAAASVWRVSATEAADRLVRDWRLFRVPDLGVVVNTG